MPPHTGLRLLESSRNDFERGRLDTFFFKAPDVGAFTGCKVCLCVCVVWWWWGSLTGSKVGFVCVNNWGEAGAGVYTRSF